MKALIQIASVLLLAGWGPSADAACPPPPDPSADPGGAYEAALCALSEAETRDDQVAAFQRIHAAAKADHPPAMTLLGDLYHDGTHLESDPSMAAFWYLRAAHAGDPDAQVKIGLRYILGLAVASDAVRGYAWVVVADRAGYARAAEVRRSLEDRFPDADLDAGEALADVLADGLADGRADGRANDSGASRQP